MLQVRTLAKYEISAMVHEIGFDRFRTLVFQDQNTHFTGTAQPYTVSCISQALYDINAVVKRLGRDETQLLSLSILLPALRASPTRPMIHPLEPGSHPPTSLRRTRSRDLRHLGCGQHPAARSRLDGTPPASRQGLSKVHGKCYLGPSPSSLSASDDHHPGWGRPRQHVGRLLAGSRSGLH